MIDTSHPSIAPRPVGVNPWVPSTVRIQAIRPEITDVATYDLEFLDGEKGARFRFLPGQFNMLYLPGVGEVAISISGDPAQHGTLAHTIRKAGNVTAALAKLSVGATLGLRGPYGTSWPIENARGKDVIL
ncbi:MAG: Ni/Fe hydrogenase subunit gamma, partial [Planctomycetota bacterium]|nr:Ni/Fe hydrogenase subunit gamma [Planctomycetota bacterium]